MSLINCSLRRNGALIGLSCATMLATVAGITPAVHALTLHAPGLTAQALSLDPPDTAGIIDNAVGTSMDLVNASQRMVDRAVATGMGLIGPIVVDPGFGLTI